MNDMHDLRVGDAERDDATAALGEHFAAGRLTKMEFDERAEQVSTARFERDLTSVFEDLPAVSTLVDAEPEKRDLNSRWRKIAPRVMWALPVMAIALLAVTVLIGAPWLLFMLFWFVAIGGFGNWGVHQHVNEQRHACRDADSGDDDAQPAAGDRAERALNRADVLTQRVSDRGIREELGLLLREVRNSR